MKKDLIVKRRCQKNAHFRKIWMTMKLMMVLFLVAITNLIASEAYSQNTKLTMQIKDATVKEVLSQIETNSEFFFLYNSKLVDVDRKVSMDVNDQKINEILSDLFRETDVVYAVVDRQIVLTNKANQISFVQPDSQQPQKVTGTVTDKEGSSLPGVNVVVTGTTQGTIADVDGKYSIDIPQGAKSLSFSFIGMEPQEISIGTSTNIDVVMTESAIGLEEVVVIGYGSAKRKDIVGSVATISSKELVNPVYSDFNQMLQGKASGVFVSNGAIRIRGMNSISSSTEPLYVIDGVVTMNASNLINTNDIESVDIQKDAAATAIFGSRASNGVIMITTKSGKKGLNAFTIDANTGFTSYINDGFVRADAATQLAALDLSIQNSHKYDPTLAVRLFDPKEVMTCDVMFLTDENGHSRNYDFFNRDYVKNFDTDLEKAVRQNGVYNEINLSTSKSFERGGLFFSLNYRDEKGQMKGDFGNRITSRLGMNFAPIKNLELGFSTTVAYNKHTNGASFHARWLPYMPLYDETNPTGFFVPAANPLAQSDHNLVDNNQTSLRSISNFNAEYTVPFVKGLSIKAVAGYDFITSRSINWSSKFMNRATNNTPFSAADENRNNGFIATANAGLNYNRTFGDHNFSGVIFQEGQKNWSYYMYMKAEKLSSIYHEIGQSPGEFKEMNAGLGDDFRMLSTLGRLGYKFKERYLLQASLRRDATSKFNPDNQDATFTSVGAGWIVSEESFFKNAVSWMNLLKIRGSIGQTGNGDMPSFKYMNAYGTGKAYMNQQYSYIQNVGNPDVTWETSTNKDIGIDFGFLKNKINGSIAYYKKNVDGLLLQVPLPMSAGIAGGNVVWQNIGDMSNSGIELSTNYAAVKSSDFSWDLSFNFSTNKNEIIALHPAIDIKGWGIEGGNAITKKGEKLATYYLCEFAGIDPQRGIPMIYEIDQAKYEATGETVKTGELIPFSSTAQAANRIIQKGKSPMPDWYGGFTNNLRYKGFDLNLTFTYTGGFYFMDEANPGARTASVGGSYNRLLPDIIENSWKKPGDNAKYQELIFGGGFYYDNDGVVTDKPVGEAYQSTRDLIRGDYLRLRLFNLGYNLPGSLVSKMKITGMRVYVSVTNALTFSKAPEAFNPETGIPGNLNGTGRGYGLPPVRTFSFGLSLSL